MYIGEAYFNGEWHSGVYPPIVDIELWNQAHAKLAKRARRKGGMAEACAVLEPDRANDLMP